MAQAKNFESKHGTLQLKRHHNYYWQIQGQMLITGMDWCDFVVFAEEDMLVQRILKDAQVFPGTVTPSPPSVGRGPFGHYKRRSWMGRQSPEYPGTDKYNIIINHVSFRVLVMGQSWMA
ncbi:uncharacterized protein LOC143519782 [Brachyhypopomus gauderio]|uniref:uncharacterized protein LOC143519782 n=1 Tax=Brachyhypopomus gauderio TaxID=698409 RepID=UPI0040434F53